jgi:NDP-sugar pyrophosphorylase family protein
MSDGVEHLTAAVLVGGLGTRLRRVVADRQKTVAPVAGHPFVFRVLDQLEDAGIQQVVLCTGYRAAQVAATVGARHGELAIRYSSEPEPLDTAGAVRWALPVLDSDPVLVMNGDSYCDLDLAAFWRAHHERRAAASIVVASRADTTAGGSVTFDDDGRITRFIEKGRATGPGWVSAGIYLLQKTVIESIPAGRRVSIERETFPAWAGRGLYAFPVRGDFLDIGTPESYALAQQYFEQAGRGARKAS